MEWLNELRGQTIGLDTAPVIYFIEEHPAYQAKVDPFFTSMAEGAFTVVTSTITLLEVLVHPLRRADAQLAGQYRDVLLRAEHLTMIDVSPAIAEEAADLRAHYSLRTPDSIQVATAIHEGATVFITNDKTLPSLPDLKTLVLADLP